MKKLIAILISVILTLSLAACGAPAPQAPAPSANPAGESSAEASLPETDELVVYTAFNATMINTIVPLFEEKYGVTVELVQAGAGELTSRIRTEADNPGGDVYFGGMLDGTFVPNIELFADYVSPLDKEMPEQYRNVQGKLQLWAAEPSILMVNTDLIGDIPTNSYADLLNPKLKGKIAFPDPALTSSGFEHLTNIMYAIGKPEDDFAAAWDYLDKLLDNASVIGSSSTAIKGCVNGEYAVTLAYESGVTEYLASGAKNLRIDYMNEGVVFQVNPIGIIKNCKNRLNAERFVDLIISQEFQEAHAQNPLYRRSLRPVTTKDPLPQVKPISEIKTIEDDGAYVSAHKSQWLEKFQQIVTSKG